MYGICLRVLLLHGLLPPEGHSGRGGRPGGAWSGLFLMSSSAVSCVMDMIPYAVFYTIAGLNYKSTNAFRTTCTAVDPGWDRVHTFGAPTGSPGRPRGTWRCTGAPAA